MGTKPRKVYFLFKVINQEILLLLEAKVFKVAIKIS